MLTAKDDILSPGEMQRICFLRLFYHKPQYAFLDESTSGLSLEVEEYLYSVCLKYGITLVSVGHRRSILKFHKSLLYLFGDGTWNLESIEQDNFIIFLFRNDFVEIDVISSYGFKFFFCPIKSVEHNDISV
ncbi:ATP-binding cassette sub-family D member 3 [Armadillidium nasatum]|uniref:ATP-binding cassette sub-family D member 3 n=1 Tax=Armadillidium nasatum TaxID=96803 RepID=A0A5N5T8A5_9CRUS|nr:ATP-binding cassette sub-family D member 3 [Armadillidium nasatum]